MSLLQRIDDDLKTALKSGDKIAVSTLRFIKSVLKNREIGKGAPLTDEDVIDVLTTLVKQRRESIEGFRRGGRADLVEKEERELAIIKSYLPEELSEEELSRLIKETIEETGAVSVREMGKVMKALMPKVKGRADGRKVSEMVKAELEAPGGS